jgi:DNA-binding protein H-NS
MAQQSGFKNMSVDELFKARDVIDRLLADKRIELQRNLDQLNRLNGGSVSRGRRAKPSGPPSSLRGKKVPAKFRNPDDASQTWAGRGAVPTWLKGYLSAGRKLEEFAISSVDSSGSSGKKTAVKRKPGRPKKPA